MGFCFWGRPKKKPFALNVTFSNCNIKMKKFCCQTRTALKFVLSSYNVNIYRKVREARLKRWERSWRLHARPGPIILQFLQHGYYCFTYHFRHVFSLYYYYGILRICGFMMLFVVINSMTEILMKVLRRKDQRTTENFLLFSYISNLDPDFRVYFCSSKRINTPLDVLKRF